MENEKFDADLRTALLAHDEAAAPLFNIERVWQKSRKNNKLTAIRVSAVAAALILALAFVLQNEQLPVKKSIAKITHKETDPVKAGKVDVNLNKAVEAKIKQVAMKASKTSITKESIVPDTVHILPDLTEAAPILAVQTVRPQTADTSYDVKVTFKRGKTPEEPAPDIRITFSKGKTLNFKWRQSLPVTDSLYYVNSTIFKFKFKP